MNQRYTIGVLSVLPALIWGSTWYIIKFQIGKVDPILSVSYRFILAGLLLLLMLIAMQKNLKYKASHHLLFALQGTCLFGLNYWMVYIAEQVLTSGLIAVVFSLNYIF
jgi:drug/metabolite transporter (DMT)-like permease